MGSHRYFHAWYPRNKKPDIDLLGVFGDLMGTGKTVAVIL